MVPLVRLEPSDFGSDGQSLNRCTTWSFVVTCSTEQRLYTSYLHEFIYSVDLRYVIVWLAKKTRLFSLVERRHQNYSNVIIFV